MQPTILLVRHSNTTYDKKVDGLLDPPLDEDGVARLQRTIKFLDDNGYRPRRILSSPLQRALRMASLIARGNAQITTNNAAGPWNLGDLMGKTDKMVEAELQRLHDYPDLKAPHGESYRTFHNRWEGFLQQAMRYAELRPDTPLCITTHSRNINDLQTVIGDAPVGAVQQSTPEASVTLLTKDDDWSFKLIWKGE